MGKVSIAFYLQEPHDNPFATTPYRNRTTDDGVVGNAQLIDLVEHLADLLVVGDDPIAVVVLSALATVLVG